VNLFLHPQYSRRRENVAEIGCFRYNVFLRREKARLYGNASKPPPRKYKILKTEEEKMRNKNAAPKALRAYENVTLRERPELMKEAAAWFHGKWGVPEEAYLECMEACLNGESDYNWYLCLDGEKIVGGMGVIENDFHDRKDLAPNVCAVYTEEEYRCRGIAGRLLDLTVEDMRKKGISPLYLVTDHTGFYERYGWEFLCMVQGDGEPDMTRMYIHR
jgi:GNAT superfamily N-acetyltransferase